jgi:hypothetical protein
MWIPNLYLISHCHYLSRTLEYSSFTSAANNHHYLSYRLNSPFVILIQLLEIQLCCVLIITSNNMNNDCYANLVIHIFIFVLFGYSLH